MKLKSAISLRQPTFIGLNIASVAICLSQMSKGKLAFTLPWREKVRLRAAFVTGFLRIKVSAALVFSPLLYPISYK